MQAIKFTVNRPTRRIRVHYGASESVPPVIQTDFGQLQWSVAQSDRPMNSILPPRSDGEELLYLWFYVQDSGTGMTPDEMKKLFKRFSQANARTHIEYGGSGIGLYICHKLVQKQDGGVGVASNPGEGSVFGFYVETRRAKEPPPASPQPTTLSHFPRRASDRSGLPARALSSDFNNSMDSSLQEGEERGPKRPTLTRPPTEPGVNMYDLLLVEDVSCRFSQFITLNPTLWLTTSCRI